METIIGLGQAGCSIADEFAVYPQYNIYKIDVGIEGDSCFNFPKQDSHENYEKNCPNIQNFLSKITGDVLFIVGGGGAISGASLSILKHIKHLNVNILYIKPSPAELTNIGILQDRVTFSVLQEYARSGALNMFYIVYNNYIEKIIGDLSITHYYKKINNFIVSSIHYINIFKNSHAIHTNEEKIEEAAKIATFGVHDLLTSSDKFFSPLSQEKNKIYYFAYPEESLEKDTSILKYIREVIKNNNIKSSYSIYPTKYSQAFCYFVSFSNVVQSVDNYL